MANPKSDNEPMVDVELRLPKTLHDDFVKFCDLTRRDRSEMAREILQLFFADGFRIGFERLRAANWQPGNPDQTDPEGLVEELYRALGKDQKKKTNPE